MGYHSESALAAMTERDRKALLGKHLPRTFVKYMLLIHLAEDAMSETEREQCYKDSAALTREIDQKGQYISANPLQSVATATSVRIRVGKRFVTDGPFAETREQLGGYFLVDVKDRQEAIEIASRIP